MIAGRSAANLVLLCAGMVIWSSAFVALYAVLSIGCAFGWENVAFGPLSLQRGILLAIWLAHIAAIVLVLVWVKRRSRNAQDGRRLEGLFALTALWATIVALAVTLANYAPILGLSMCL